MSSYTLQDFKRAYEEMRKAPSLISWAVDSTSVRDHDLIERIAKEASKGRILVSSDDLKKISDDLEGLLKDKILNDLIRQFEFSPLRTLPDSSSAFSLKSISRYQKQERQRKKRSFKNLSKNLKDRIKAIKIDDLSQVIEGVLTNEECDTACLNFLIEKLWSLRLSSEKTKEVATIFARAINNFAKDRATEKIFNLVQVCIKGGNTRYGHYLGFSEEGFVQIEKEGRHPSFITAVFEKLEHNFGSQKVVQILTSICNYSLDYFFVYAALDIAFEESPATLHPLLTEATRKNLGRMAFPQNHIEKFWRFVARLKQTQDLGKQVKEAINKKDIDPKFIDERTVYYLPSTQFPENFVAYLQAAKGDINFFPQSERGLTQVAEVLYLQAFREKTPDILSWVILLDVAKHERRFRDIENILQQSQGRYAFPAVRP